MAITNHDRVELKRAVNSWDSHHVRDLLGPLPTKAQVDQHAKDVILRAAYYFGIGQPTIRSWDEHGFSEQDVHNLIEWFTRPSDFYKSHRLASGVSKSRIAFERAKRAVTKVFLTRKFEGVTVAGWIYNILVAARKDNVPFHVTDGVRSMAEAWALWDDRANNPNPVSYPGTSHHTGVRFPDGAVDIVTSAQAFSNWLRSHPKQARGLTWAAPDDVVHFSIPGSHHPGEGSY